MSPPPSSQPPPPPSPPSRRSPPTRSQTPASEQPPPPAPAPAPAPPPPPARRRPQPFDPWNSSSTGHQRAENRLAASTGWRDSRNAKLLSQFRGSSSEGRREPPRVSDRVGAGSAHYDPRARAIVTPEVRARARCSVADMLARPGSMRGSGGGGGSGGGDGGVVKRTVVKKEEGRGSSSNTKAMATTMKTTSSSLSSTSAKPAADPRPLGVGDSKECVKADNHNGDDGGGGSGSDDASTAEVSIAMATTVAAATEQHDEVVKDQDRDKDEQPEAKKKKRERSEERPSSGSGSGSNHDDDGSKRRRTRGIFDGVVVYVNGSTHPLVSDHKLKHLLAEHGGRLSTHLGRRQVTHVILGRPSTTATAAGSGGSGGGLAGGKLQREIRKVGGCAVQFVGAEWVLESVRAGRRLGEAGFGNVKIAAKGQQSVLGLFSKSAGEAAKQKHQQQRQRQGTEAESAPAPAVGVEGEEKDGLELPPPSGQAS
ncbi:hypothetical protein SLS62_007159 [Diatrype stigma]|uniref:BRCT domain-containing protein n=1 Tax=Diatrype stigma TaxID=117547 RepID=A0AAN9UN55_9PEZI